jgi:hypothetical protein
MFLNGTFIRRPTTYCTSSVPKLTTEGVRRVSASDAHVKWRGTDQNAELTFGSDPRQVNDVLVQLRTVTCSFGEVFKKAEKPRSVILSFAGYLFFRSYSCSWFDDGCESYLGDQNHQSKNSIVER